MWKGVFCVKTLIQYGWIVDPATGQFSFIAKLTNFGNNTVRFRVTKEGKQDAVISMTVNYTPTLAQYSAKAWKMDYVQLSKYFENWLERIFLCEGPVLDKFLDGDTEYVVMDVGTGGKQQLVVLENHTSISPTMGPSYSAYADVTGRYFYNAEYYPMLAARYMDLTAEK